MVPFVLLAILNFLLVYTVLSASKSTVETEHTGGVHNSFGMKRKLQMTKTIIILTITFIVLTLPGAIVSAYYNDIIATEAGDMLINMSDNISFSFHALGFLTLFLSNKQFSAQVKSMFDAKLAREETGST